MVRMKPLKTFRVSSLKRIVQGGSNEEFEVSDAVAREYEMRGLAVAVGAIAKPARVPGKVSDQNKAAAAGPLASPGGKTGAATPPSSSPAGRAPKPSRSPRRATKPGS